MLWLLPLFNIRRAVERPTIVPAIIEMRTKTLPRGWAGNESVWRRIIFLGSARRQERERERILKICKRSYADIVFLCVMRGAQN